ncbi:MAG: site-specific DNA-methyltransferase [Clostridia bacterium]|nr:site-specific DNA-methyltransferase [Clostridia bacterium]
MLERIYGVTRETRGGGASRVIVGDAAEACEKLARELPGQVSLIYLDPPYATGKSFKLRARVGAAEWKSGNGSLELPAYDDDLPFEEYMSLMRRVLTASKALLAQDGLVFLHCDFRMHAHLRLLADEIFGSANFLNEIIWTYDTGGRSKRFFARKHEDILLYSVSPEYDLHTEDVALVPAQRRRSHMKKNVDDDGRTYYTITSNGRLYRYYEDTPVPPTDVWNDVSHLQQKDPQRLGYDTQKPLALLERIVKSASRQGDIVLDPFCGSGTTLEAAFKNRRLFIGVDKNPMCIEYARQRLSGAECTFDYPESEGTPECSAQILPGLAYSTVCLQEYTLGECSVPLHIQGLDAVNGWAVGTVKDGCFTPISEEHRSFKRPRLTFEAQLPFDTESPVIMINDVLGRRFFFSLRNI